MPTKLILIRHAVTSWNQKKKYCGFMDIGISTKGKVQARLLKKRLMQEKAHKVYSSDRKRAIETAEIIFERMRIGITPSLREMHFGILEGLTHNEALKRDAKAYKRWLKEPYKVRIPQGESLSGFKKRVVGAFKKIISLNHNKTVAVACHGGTIGIFVAYLLKSKDFWKHIPGSASITVIEYKNKKPAILLLNDMRHLS
jgi:broad specificity phosphatase PhoE